MSEATDLRLADLRTFLAVLRSASLSATAREQRVTTSQVSKAIGRVELHFARKLVERGSRGVVPSEAGRVLAPALEAIVAQVDAARAVSPERVELTVGAPSYIQAHLLPVIARATPDIRLRAVELPPELLRANAHDERYDLLLLTGGGHHLPASWVAENVGTFRRALFAAPALRDSLGAGPYSIDRMAQVPFIMPTCRYAGRDMPLDDEFPLPRALRNVGHQVESFDVGLTLAAQGEHVIFGPLFAARAHLESGLLVEIPIDGYDTHEPLTFAYNVDRISARIRTDVGSALRIAMRGEYEWARR